MGKLGPTQAKHTRAHIRKDNPLKPAYQNGQGRKKLTHVHARGPGAHFTCLLEGRGSKFFFLNNKSI